MKVGIPKEIHDGEKRVAATPDSAEKIIKLGLEVSIESGAGLASDITDDAYKNVGVSIVEDVKELWRHSDIILKVRAPQFNDELSSDEVNLIPDGQTIISYIWPAQNEALMQALADKKTTIVAMDAIPRISRAQKMDALSSMANISGYRSVVEAAQHFGRFFTGQITAAGKIPAAKVLVIGVGVAGLSAIGTAKGMGAIVRAFDVRPEVKEQVESMDAEFLMLDFDEEGSGEGGYAKTMSKRFLDAEMALFATQAAEVDIIITTALIPGKPAPTLITEDMVKAMKTGSVIVDLAAEQGGNCAYTEKEDVVTKHGVTIIGYTNLPSRLSNQASQLYGSNIYHLLTELCPEKNGNLFVNMENEVIRGAVVVQSGEITWPPPPVKLSVESPNQVKQETVVSVAILEESAIRKAVKRLIPMLIVGMALLGIGAVAPTSFMSHFTIFVLSCFIGYQVIWNVSASLHTPLMSVTNAISGIIVIGAVLHVSSDNNLISLISGVAILIAAINIVGGFLVTRRMLDMFRK